MTVSVRMDTVLEREIEQAAQRAGVTKSQFIIDAVEKALGRKDAYSTLLEAHRQYGIHTPASAVVARQSDASAGLYRPAALRSKLVAQHDADMADWLAFQAAREAGNEWHPDGTPPEAIA